MNKNNLIIESLDVEAFREILQEEIKKEMSRIVPLVDRLISTKETAHLLDCDVQTVRRLVHNGYLENKNKTSSTIKLQLSEVMTLDWRKYQSKTKL